MLTMQMIKIMDRLWLKAGLDLKIITFACLATGPKKGVLFCWSINLGWVNIFASLHKNCNYYIPLCVNSIILVIIQFESSFCDCIFYYMLKFWLLQTHTEHQVSKKSGYETRSWPFYFYPLQPTLSVGKFKTELNFFLVYGNITKWCPGEFLTKWTCLHVNGWK